MNKQLWRWAVIGLLPGSCHAIGIRITNQDAAAMARGNAFVATADNASAVYYNPAGITQLSGQHARAGIYAVYLNSRYTAPSGEHVETFDKIQGVGQLYYTYTPQKCPVAVGLGVYSPFGLGAFWPNNAPFRDVGTKSELIYTAVNPVAAWRISDSLSIAAGPAFNYADVYLRQGIGGDPLSRFQFRGDDTAWDATAGILWQPLEEHSFGISYRSPTDVNFGGHTAVAVNGLPTIRQQASLEFPFPQNVAVGYSYRPTPKWNLEADVDWTDWSALKSTTLQTASGAAREDFFWRSGFIYKFGATRALTEHVRASAGYWYAEETVPDAHFTPLVADQALHVFSAGIEWQRGAWLLDAGYQFGYGPNRTVVGSEPQQGQSADGVYRWINHAVAISVAKQF